MSQVLPCASLLSYTGPELRLLLCGAGACIDIGDWCRNTLYTNGYSPEHLVVQWFWRFVAGASDEVRRALLTFVTGTTSIPAGGFAELQVLVQGEGLG